MIAIRIIEAAAARNLLDFAQAVPGAAALECAGGVAAFLGAGSPLTTIKGAGPDISTGAMQRAEEFFRQHGADACVFEVAPWISPETVEHFAETGYEVVGNEDVLLQVPPFQGESVKFVEEIRPEDWPAVMISTNGTADDLPQWIALAKGVAALPGIVRLGIRKSATEWVACAATMPVHDGAFFGNAATLGPERGRGLQTALIRERLRRASLAGYDWVATEVAPDSSSERNCLRCGFEILYTRTFYGRTL